MPTVRSLSSSRLDVAKSILSCRHMPPARPPLVLSLAARGSTMRRPGAVVKCAFPSVFAYGLTRWTGCRRRTSAGESAEYSVPWPWTLADPHHSKCPAAADPLIPKTLDAGFASRIALDPRCSRRRRSQVGGCSEGAGRGRMRTVTVGERDERVGGRRCRDCGGAFFLRRHDLVTEIEIDIVKRECGVIPARSGIILVLA